MDSGPLVVTRVAPAARGLLLVIAAGTAMRLLLAAVLGLGVDESYMVAVARRLSWSYFDHPPLSFWMIHAATALLGSEHRLVVRLPFIMLFAVTTWLMYRLSARLFGERAGLVAALLLTISPVFSLSSGGWALPDGPLMFGTLLAALALTHATLDPETRRTAWWWLLAGAATGAAMLSKYHGALLALGLLAFCVTQPAARTRLLRPAPIAAAVLALALFAPVLLWNASHEWVSIRFQVGRGAPQHGLHPFGLVRSLGGQALYLLPWLGIPLAWVFAQALRAGPRDARRWLPACVAAGPIVIFTAPSLGGDPGLPHWEAPGWLMLFPLLGAAAAARLVRGERGTRWWLGGSAAAFAAITVVVVTQAATGWLTRESRWAARTGDPTLEMLDWSDLAPAARTLGVGRDGMFVVAGNWIQAGKAAYALGPDATVLCLCEEPHHFRYEARAEDWRGRDALIVEAGRRSVPSRFAASFRSIEPAGEVRLSRAGRTAMVLELSVGRGFAGR